MNALISVSDKKNLVEFAKGLTKRGIRIISTGGTMKHLRDHGLDVIPVSQLTGYPEILNGRVKTLHPMIHGGILGRKDLPAHVEEMKKHAIEPIDMVVVNLYPFQETIRNPGISLDDAIEQIDIGGPSMLRSAAKNFSHVIAICDPDDYSDTLQHLDRNGGTIPDDVRLDLALKVFHHTALYDTAIAEYLGHRSARKATLPETLGITLGKSADLRYGENPHQRAALYGDFFEFFEKIHGKELSFNNIVDIQAGVDLVTEFDDPAAGIIKHTNPCGCAIGTSLEEAYQKALSTDPVSAFGGIAAFNREVDASLANILNRIFLEVVIAPSFTAEALEILRIKKDRRLIAATRLISDPDDDDSLEIKRVHGGLLAQTRDIIVEDQKNWRIVTKREPTEREHRALAFAWKVAKHVKSNAIVYASEHQTLGVGAGQMSRVDSSMLAAHKARSAGLDLKNSVVASDAFFPFADGLLEAVQAGATAVIEPGGSVRDAEVIQAADENGIAMVFTGIRHFKH